MLNASSQKIYTLTTQTLGKKLLSHLKFSNFPRHIVHYRASFDHLYFLVVDPFVLSPKISKAFCQLITDKSWISSQDDFLCKTSRRSLILGSLVKSVVCFLFLLNILYSPLICGRHRSCMVLSLSSATWKSYTVTSGNFSTCSIASCSSLYMKCPGISTSSFVLTLSLTIWAVSKDILPSFLQCLLRLLRVRGVFITSIKSRFKASSRVV